MAVSMYAIAVPTFQKQLTALDAILDKATEYAAAKKIDISVLLAARLYPDMFNLTRQVQLATDFARPLRRGLPELEFRASRTPRRQCPRSNSVSPRRSHFSRTLSRNS